MEGFFIPYKGTFLLFKLGLKGLMYLADFSCSNEAEIELEEILYAGIIGEQPWFPHKEVLEIKLDSALRNRIEAIKITLPSQKTIEEWYRRGIGEIGLPLSTFYCLTPYELDLAYEGYLRRAELNANLSKLVSFQINNKDHELIKIVPEKTYSLGSLEERENVFKYLGIQEE